VICNTDSPRSPTIGTESPPVELGGEVVNAHGEDGAADEGLGGPEEVRMDELVVDAGLGVQVLENVRDDVVQRVRQTLLLLWLLLLLLAYDDSN
jgi:hypothetical protein